MIDKEIEANYRANAHAQQPPPDALDNLILRAATMRGWRRRNQPLIGVSAFAAISLILGMQAMNVATTPTAQAPSVESAYGPIDIRTRQTLLEVQALPNTAMSVGSGMDGPSNDTDH